MFGLWFHLLISILILLTGIILFIRMIGQKEVHYDKEEKNKNSIEYLKEVVRNSFDELLSKKIEELNLNKEESLKRDRIKVEIQKNLRICSQGNLGAKLFIKDYMEDILLKKCLTKENINHFIPFGNKTKLTAQDRFEILLHTSKRDFYYDGLKELLITYELDCIKQEEGEEFYEISKEDVEAIYFQERPNLTFIDKVQIITQRVYQELYGLGAIDEIRDMKIDGVSGGVSGIPFEFYSYDLEWMETVKRNNLNSYNSIWIFFKGNSYRLSFLGFQSQNELIRVCKNIHKYGNPGQFSEEKGYILNEMKDGSRVVVFRPPFSLSWAFFVRKLDSVEKKEFKSLIVDKGNEQVEFLIKSLIKSHQTIVITGEQGSGKTSLLLSLLEFLGRTTNLRVYETVFELYAQKVYPKMNILSLRDTDTIGSQEALDIIKKTDGTDTVLGEVATYEACTYMIDIKKVNKKSTLATHHADTTYDLVDFFRNGWLKVGGFRDERLAEEQAANTLNFDIHMVNNQGHRYIERISEIIPLQNNDIPKNLNEAMFFYFRKMTIRGYKVVDIVRFEEGEYKFINQISQKVKNQIQKYLTIDEKDIFFQLFEHVRDTGVMGENYDGQYRSNDL